MWPKVTVTRRRDGAVETMTDSLLPADETRRPRRPAGAPRIHPLTLAFRDALADNKAANVQTARTTVREGVGSLPALWNRVVAWLTPIQDPVLGDGWRCTLHAFSLDGRFVRAQESAFEPAQAARYAVERLQKRAE